MSYVLSSQALSTSLEERAAGMLAGVAIGDALGMPAEFLSPEQIRDWYGQVDGLLAPHPEHPHHRLVAGSVTDDTDQTLILAQLLIEQGSVAPNEFAKRLLAWSETPRVRENRFVGPSTQKALAALARGVPFEEIPRSGTSVGAAMRVAPLAIAFPDRSVLAEQVVASCAVSHFTRNAISGAMAMAYALSEALQPGGDACTGTGACTSTGVLSVARAAQAGAVIGRDYGDWSWAAPIERRIAYALAWAESCQEVETLTRLYALIGVDLYPEQLVPCAIALAYLAQGDPQRAMLLAANLGGDTDTLASMTGSICGALSGLTAFDPAVVAQVERVNRLDLVSTARSLVALRMAQQ
jgi:ADP-ribosylglycohydrolase